MWKGSFYDIAIISGAGGAVRLRKMKGSDWEGLMVLRDL